MSRRNASSRVSRTPSMLEGLESRIAFSVTVAPTGSGDLKITGVPDGTLAITAVANNQLQVVDNGVDLGTFNAPKNVKVTLGAVSPSAPRIVNFNLATFTLSGSVSFETGNSPYTVTLSRGTIQGNVTAKMGTAGDTFFIGASGGTTVGGKVSVDAGKGADNIFLNAGTNITGNVELLNGQNNATDQPCNIGGNLKIDASDESLNVRVSMGINVAGRVQIELGNGNDTVNFNTNSVIGGDMDIDLNGGNDSVNFGSGAGGPGGGASIGGDLEILGDAGNDSVTFGGIAATLGGDFFFKGGVGNDTLKFGANSVVNGTSIRFDGNDGNDTLETTGQLTASNVHFNFSGGNGDDFVDLISSMPILASAN